MSLQSSESVQGNPTIKKAPRKRHEESVAPGAVLGGSLRGALVMIAKRISIRSVLRKRAFLTIDGRAAKKNSHIKVVGPQRKGAHNKLAVASQSLLMGIVVFGTYDAVLNSWKKSKKKQQQHDKNNHETEYSTEEINIEPSIVVHGAAGAASGVARSIFWMTWEAAVYRIFFHSNFLLRTTLHNAACYGTLFGTYQSIRHLVTASLDDRLNNNKNDNNEDKYNPVYLFDILGTAVAGGVAGQVHHVVNHYTSHWNHFHPKRPPLPSLYPTLSAFGPMSLCFLAFEYGDDIVEGVEALYDKMKVE